MAEREGFTDAEKKGMLLSPETSTGIKLTGKKCKIIIIM